MKTTLVKKLSLAGITVAALLCNMQQAQANPAPPATANTVLTFDDIYIPNDYKIMPTGYGGFTWSNLYVIKNTAIPNSGYTYGNVSAPNSMFNAGGNIGSFSSSTAFTLGSMYVTKSFETGNTHFNGYVGNILTYSMDVLSMSTSPTFSTFNWANLNLVTISTGGGRTGGGPAVIDNVTIGAVSAVPEPATYATLLAGLGLMGFMVRRRKTS